MGIIKIYNDKKWTLQFLDALYNSIDMYVYVELGSSAMYSMDHLRVMDRFFILKV
jgi:hypothetical protein